MSSDCDISAIDVMDPYPGGLTLLYLGTVRRGIVRRGTLATQQPILLLLGPLERQANQQTDKHG